MKTFNLSEWLQDKSRKVIDDDGFPVEIIKWDANEKCPVVYLNHNGIAYNVSVDGMYDADPNHGLFFADEEEQDEFENTMVSFAHAMFDHLLDITKEIDIKEWKDKLLDLARKELQPEFDKKLKEFYNQGGLDTQEEITKCLPKWKKITQREQNYLAYGYLSHDGYYLSIQELKDKLPKEE